MKIGFVGLGLMGRPMAARLIEAGHEVHVFSASADAVGALAGPGRRSGGIGRRCGRPRRHFLFLPRHAGPVARGLYRPRRRALGRPRPAAVHRFRDHRPDGVAGDRPGARAPPGAGYIDAPVSGGPHAAAAGTLTIIAGGEAAAVARAGPLFDSLGKRTFHMGGTGAGVAAKLCNNLITITSHALIAEAMVLGARAGNRRARPLRGAVAKFRLQPDAGTGRARPLPAAQLRGCGIHENHNERPSGRARPRGGRGHPVGAGRNRHDVVRRSRGPRPCRRRHRRGHPAHGGSPPGSGWDRTVSGDTSVWQEGIGQCNGKSFQTGVRRIAKSSVDTTLFLP